MWPGLDHPPHPAPARRINIRSNEEEEIEVSKRLGGGWRSVKVYNHERRKDANVNNSTSHPPHWQWSVPDWAE